jgi:hypothetical protein
VETIAHLRADGRITLMFCAFDDPPRIVRLYGRGAVHEPKDEAHDALRSRLPDLPGARAITGVEVDRVSSSCGFGVPLMDLVGPREQLVESARRKGRRRWPPTGLARTPRASTVFLAWSPSSYRRSAGTVEARPRRDRRRLREEAIVGRGRLRGGVTPVMSQEGRTFRLSRESGRRIRYRTGDLNDA